MTQAIHFLVFWTVVLVGLFQAPAIPTAPLSWRLTRTATTAAIYQWAYQTIQDIPADQVACNLEPAELSGLGFRVADPQRPGRECEWRTTADAPIFQNMLEGFSWRWTLQIKTEEYGPLSEPADVSGGPTNLRIKPPGGH